VGDFSEAEADHATDPTEKVRKFGKFVCCVGYLLGVYGLGFWLAVDNVGGLLKLSQRVQSYRSEGARDKKWSSWEVASGTCLGIRV